MKYKIIAEEGNYAKIVCEVQVTLSLSLLVILARNHSLILSTSKIDAPSQIICLLNVNSKESRNH